MRPEQVLWLQQARSDYALFLRLRRTGVAEPCHQLHYLQMTTEKLSKAYLWRSGIAPPKTHTGFVRFLKALTGRGSGDLERIAKVFGFGRPDDMEDWIVGVRQLASDLQNTAPAEAQNGPNPEYPWPHSAPTECPATFSFPLWEKLTNTGQGRKLMEFIGTAVGKFEIIA